MSRVRHSGELALAHRRAYRDWIHAQETMEREVGDVLRSHQRLILSVLEKLNGLVMGYSQDSRFFAGQGKWAVELRRGFEVVDVGETLVTIRSLVSPTSDVRPLTYALPIELLSMSDRQVASALRASVRENKERAKAYQKHMEEVRLRGLARTIEKKKAQVAKLEEDYSTAVRSVKEEVKA